MKNKNHKEITGVFIIHFLDILQKEKNYKKSALFLQFLLKVSGETGLTLLQ